jgi:hypothetical protein
MSEELVEFEVVGLTESPVHIYDRRDQVKKTMSQILVSGNVWELADEFNKPANVSVISRDSGSLEINLDETKSKKLDYMLWIAVGIESLPIYHYKITKLESIGIDQYALVSLYRRPHGRERDVEFNLSSSPALSL